MKNHKKNFGGGNYRGGNRNGGDRSRGGRSFGGNRGGGRDRDFTQMHKATCSECGGVAEVPFKPTGEKPVLCSDCFGKQRDGGRRDHGDRRDDRGRDRDFGNDRRPTQGDNSALVERFDSLNKKLDKIIKALDIKEPFESKDVFRAPKEEVKPKVPKRAPAEAGALKKVVAKALPKKKATAKKTVTKKVAAKKTAVKKAPVKKVEKKTTKKATAKKTVKKVTKKK